MTVGCVFRACRFSLAGLAGFQKRTEYDQTKTLAARWLRALAFLTKIIALSHWIDFSARCIKRLSLINESASLASVVAGVVACGRNCGCIFNSDNHPKRLDLKKLSNQQKWFGPFTFALLADPQLGLYQNNHSWGEELQQVSECIAAAVSSSPTPAFIAILGDLVHAPVPAQAVQTDPSITEVWRVRDQQARDLADAIDGPSKEVPVVVAAGNHDIGSTPTREAIADYESLWGKDYYSFWFGGVKFVVANSSVFYDDAETSREAENIVSLFLSNSPLLALPSIAIVVAYGGIGAVQLDRGGVSRRRAKHTFLLQHHQFYWKGWNEEEETTEMVEVPQMKKSNSIKIYRLPGKWRRRFLTLLKQYKVSASFHGHLHYDSLLCDEGLSQIVSASCGFATNDSRPGWRLVKVSENSFEHKFLPVKWRTDNYPFKPPRFP
ncbi:serine/threonine-protein phosphatase CPPED1 [Cyclospora cayetanensis]|uniref:Serine/threonine-protein phosphatase CPPED1 n=1 Tax=Cyclospora cayetanensis TaxID=88456 RepID=A0A6P6RZ09_9EIME|nr:serine/threonine-protein phosphatase CPPED1 [Cyclospora cayetanensis]